MIDKEKLRVLASVWLRSSKSKLQKLKRDLQLSHGAQSARLLDMTLHERSPEEYETKKSNIEDSLGEISLELEVLNLILKKK